MDPFKGPCPHHSIPVEMGETLDLERLPPCEHCNAHTETVKRLEAREFEPPQRAAQQVGLSKFPENQYKHQFRINSPAAPLSGHVNAPYTEDFWHVSLRQKVQYKQDPIGPSSQHWSHSVDDADYLEPPQPLKSDFNSINYVKMPIPHMPRHMPMQGSCLKQCACCPPANPRGRDNYCHQDPGYPAGRHQEPQPHQKMNLSQNGHQLKGALNGHCGSAAPYATPPLDVMHEVSVGCSDLAGAGSGTKEIRRTISLPEECRNVFITYSVDIAKEMFIFVKFLVGQGFRPSLDMFDSSIRNMGINQWMDRFLNDKSVLIIVAISPKYKADVEGDGVDEHGLHTKYIHNQIQNEYIQQGCLNFRLVPVMFPNAAKIHVPSWLQSTRIYRWPQDTQDLLLRLLREERYIIPHRSADLTLTFRPV
ncbi:uncharacterized protein traf3ip2a [Pelmatolapia mariae]|uniref:uncharacterized protein traf3ip2a n=1 Tax=Pelmatolapia mariae TaxID=158779 RepID=UPI002FE66635